MHDIMTIEEVAGYIRVSERTVYDWAQKGEIPGGKLGTAWRFKRSDIENWVNDRLSSSDERKRVTAVTTSHVLTPERVILLGSATKEAVLTRLVDVLSETPFVQNRDALLRGIVDREALMSTGIGFGIGVPHVRMDTVSDLVMAVAICKEPITDYASLDEEPVQIVCMVAARKDQHAQYIRTLSAISSLLKNALTRERIIHADEPGVVYQLFTGTEPS